MRASEDVDKVRKKYQALRHELDERGRRLWAAVEAEALGYGGITTVSQATGLAASTIRLGHQQLNASADNTGDAERRRLRTPGGGRKRTIDKDTTLWQALDALVEPTARGDPMSPLRWTCKSTRHLARELANRLQARWPVAFGTGGRTKFNRTRQGYQKDQKLLTITAKGRSKH